MTEPKGPDWTDERGTSEEGKSPRRRGRAADWTEERGSEERATERRGKEAGPAPLEAQSRQSWWAEAGPPIQVEGGIKARSKRGAIGEQWWSRRFVEVLESFGMSGRLARGRNYARRGQVLEFELGHGVVRARVQGSRPVPYQVRIGVLPLTTAQWRRVIEALRGQALFRAKLLAGDMPHEIERVFADCGTPLFPRSARDLDLFCSCPDWGVPCKHLAAVCYVLAERFDDDPFGMLAWRGRDRADLLAALRGPGLGPGRGRRTAAGPGGGRGAGPGGRAAGAVPGPVLVAGGEPGPAAGRPDHPAGTARPAAALGRAARRADPRRRAGRPARPGLPAAGQPGYTDGA